MEKPNMTHKEKAEEMFFGSGMTLKFN